MASTLPFSYRSVCEIVRFPECISSFLFTAMLELALESCCFKCNKAVYEGPFEHTDRFFMQNFSLAMPAQTSLLAEKYLGIDYINMLPVKTLSVFAIPPERDLVKIGNVILVAILGTWPLLLLVLLMSTAAGICVWLLVSSPTVTRSHSMLFLFYFF